MKNTIVIAVVILGLFAPRPAQAQLNGNDVRIDHGIDAGTMPAPGLYVGTMYLFYDTDTLKSHQGNTFPTTGKSSINAVLPMVTWVSPAKILGGNFGVLGAAAIQDNALNAPLFGFDIATGFAAGDTYLQPFILGWHAPQADFTTWVGLYAPTGRFVQGGDNNTGLGQTTLEFSGGSTVYFDSGKTVSAATIASWETHSAKKDTDTTVGQLLTLKGGVGKAFKQGALKVGGAYYAQWKLTADTFGSAALDELAAVNKQRAFGAGPDVTVPIAAGGKLIALINARAEWEFAARSTTQGFWALVTATFPMPSVTIK